MRVDSVARVGFSDDAYRQQNDPAPESAVGAWTTSRAELTLSAIVGCPASGGRANDKRTHDRDFDAEV